MLRTLFNIIREMYIFIIYDYLHVFQGSISYVPQQAWIQNKTLRDNILFSKPYTHSLYQKTLSACAMTEDLKILPGGDHTEIGEKVIKSNKKKFKLKILLILLYNNVMQM